MKIGDLVLIIEKEFKIDFGKVGKIVEIFDDECDWQEGLNIYVSFHKHDFNYFSENHLIVIRNTIKK